MNRKFMSDADFSTWTPLEYVAEYVYICSSEIKSDWSIERNKQG